VLTLPTRLPPGALLDQEGERLRPVLAESGALWLSAGADWARVEDGRLTGWAARAGGRSAVPAAANTGGSTMTDWHGHPALSFAEGVNGGMTVPEAATDAETFTLALIYAAPAQPARTMLSLLLGPSDAANLLFLSHLDGVLTARDRSGGVAVELFFPDRTDRFRLVLLSWDAGRMTMRAGGRETQATGRLSGDKGPVDLFIGCRGARRGLGKTLGAGLIGDVIFWPGRALLSSDAEGDRAQLAALESYARWTYGGSA
jgi:hypothetical protein